MDATDRVRAEPQDAFNDYARLVADQQLGVVLGFHGHLDAEKLSRAVAELCLAQPVLGCRLVREGRRAWHERVSAPATVTLVEADVPWPTAVYLAGQVLDPEGPHLNVTHVVGPAGDALAIRVDHTAADGQGVKAVAELLAAAYNGALASDPRAAAADRSWTRLRRAVGLPRLVAAARQRTDPRPTWGIPRSGDATGQRHHDLLTLSAERFSAVKAWGREHGYTVNDIVLGAYYRALFTMLSPHERQPMVIRVSFDERRYLRPENPMPAACNLSSVEPVELGRLAGERFGGTVARVAAEMRRIKSHSPGLGSVLLLEMLYRLHGYEALGRSQMAQMRRGQEAGVTYPFLSNFGVLSPEKLAFGELEPTVGVMLPVAAHPPFTMLGVSSFGGRLTMSLGFAEGEVHPSVPKRLLAAMEADLPGSAAEAARLPMGDLPPAEEPASEGPQTLLVDAEELLGGGAGADAGGAG